MILPCCGVSQWLVLFSPHCYHIVGMHHLCLCLLPCWGASVLFPTLAVVNQAPVCSICMQAFVEMEVCSSRGQIPKCIISGSYMVNLCSTLEETANASSTVAVAVFPPATNVCGSESPGAFGIFRFSDFAYRDRCVVRLHGGFNWHFSSK